VSMQSGAQQLKKDCQNWAFHLSFRIAALWGWVRRPATTMQVAPPTRAARCHLVVHSAPCHLFPQGDYRLGGPHRLSHGGESDVYVPRCPHAHPQRLVPITCFLARKDRAQVREGKKVRYFLRRSPPRSAPHLLNRQERQLGEHAPSSRFSGAQRSAEVGR